MMGYFVKIVESTARIRSKHLDEAYRKMCELNKRDELKRGGEWGPGAGKVRSWFSWMPENYPDECKDAQAVLEELGFETQTDESGDLLIVAYDNKMGQEDLFLNSVADLVEGRILWVGEDAHTWVWDGKAEPKKPSP